MISILPFTNVSFRRLGFFDIVKTGNLDDLHSFDPATMTWTPLSSAVDAHCPFARRLHGFTSAGGLLYVHGGWGIMDASGRLGTGGSTSPWRTRE